MPDGTTATPEITEIATVSSPESPTSRSFEELKASSRMIETGLSADPRFQGIREAQRQEVSTIFEAVRNKKISEEEAHTMLANDRTELIIAAGDDSLTELRSRVGFEDAMTIGINFDRRTNDRTSIMFIDLDGFKSANDTAGHQAGDQILIATGGLIAEQLTRASDVGARFGGDEFAIGLPSASKHAAIEKTKAIAKDLPSTADEIVNEMGKSLAVPVTMSAGIVELKHDHGDKRSSREILQEMLGQADETMYFAKLLGKNRIVERIVKPNGEVYFADVTEDESDFGKIIYKPIRDIKGKINDKELIPSTEADN